MRVIYNPVKEAHYFPKVYQLIGVHAIAIAGTIYFGLRLEYFLIFFIVGFFIGCLGIEMTYHRCLTHRAFEFRYKWMEYAFATLATLALQQGPLWWCSLHRIHHRYPDSDQDPHDSRKGFWYSHALWLFHLDPRWELPADIKKYQELVPDLASDPYYRWLDKYCYLPMCIFLFLIFIIGGWEFLFWGIFTNAIVWNLICSVNSLSHWFGYRSYPTNPLDLSANNFLTGLLAMGGGWHNNHHAFPSSARNGFFHWWELDITYLAILFLKRLGLVNYIKVPKLSQLKLARMV